MTSHQHASANAPTNLLTLLNANQHLSANGHHHHHHHHHHAHTTDYLNEKINDENKSLIGIVSTSSKMTTTTLASSSAAITSPDADHQSMTNPADQHPTTVNKILSSSNRSHMKKSGGLSNQQQNKIGTHAVVQPSSNQEYIMLPIISLKNELIDNNNNDIHMEPGLVEQQQQQQHQQRDSPSRTKAKTKTLTAHHTPPMITNSTIITLLSPSNSKQTTDDFLLTISSKKQRMFGIRRKNRFGF
jgi:hypothetical protein